VKIHDLKPSTGATKRRKRLARGIGSGHGKTASRGSKGQGARRQISPWFEGGQTPIIRRLPVKKGFRNINHKEFAEVNVAVLEKHFADGDAVTPEILIAKRLVNTLKDGLKILAFGDLTKKLNVTAHHFSAAAKAKIEAVGGTTETL
jgi:large subunit ribosomal protein L15